MYTCSVLNGALYDMEQAQSRICEFAFVWYFSSHIWIDENAGTDIGIQFKLWSRHFSQKIYFSNVYTPDFRIIIISMQWDLTISSQSKFDVVQRKTILTVCKVTNIDGLYVNNADARNEIHAGIPWR